MNKQYDFMDVLNILSFYIGLENLDENLSQKSAQEMLEKAVDDIHNHLKEQDSKIEEILRKIYESD